MKRIQRIFADYETMSRENPLNPRYPRSIFMSSNQHISNLQIIRTYDPKEIAK